MKVEEQIEGHLRDRQDLIRSVRAAAAYLAARDTDPDSQARARWTLGSGPDGEVRVVLELDDRGYSTARTFSPGQLADENRDLRLVMIWNDVLSERTWREFEHVNNLLREYQENRSGNEGG